jgi:hypothetical protein
VSGGFNRHVGALINVARGRSIVFEASRAFNLVGAVGFYWFRKRAVEAIDDDQARAEFIEWLRTSSDREIEGFVEAMPVYRRALADELASDPPKMEPNERGGVLRGDSGRIAWNKSQKLAGIAATQVLERARRATDGKKGAEGRKQQGQATKEEVLRVALEAQIRRKFAKATRNQIADEVSKQLGISQDRAFRLLGREETEQKIVFAAKGARSTKNRSV